MGKIDQQIFHYNETIKISETIKDTVMLGYAKMNLGGAYFNQGKLDSALIMEQNAERMIASGENKKYLGSLYNRIGQIFLKQQKNAQAAQYFRKGIEASIVQNNEGNLSRNYSLLTKFYLSIIYRI